FRIGALVLHKDKLRGLGLGQAQDLAARAGLGPPAQEDDQLVVYRPPAAAPPAAWANLALSTWYARETDPATGSPTRWMGAAGTIRVWRPTATAATLHLSLVSFATPRRLTMVVDGQAGPPVSIPPQPTDLDIPLPAASGATTIILRALDPPTAPSSVGAGADPRLLSVALVGCTLR
ncbi:MAG TPA: hypothetical protein VM536_00575, partial [Chloroflexia bacterium]|nr:hypothetical protein [Chloroflexia bacterium]